MPHRLDPYRQGTSPIHRLDHRVRVVMVLVFILVTALTPAGAFPVFILLLAFMISAELLTDLGFIYFLKRSLLALPFAFAALPSRFPVQPGRLGAFYKHHTKILDLSAGCGAACSHDAI